MAQANIIDFETKDNSDKFIDIDNLDSPDGLINPELRAYIIIQLGMHRLEGAADTYLPRTLPPRLYQTNPFVQQMEPTETDKIQYQLSAAEVAPTAQEMEAMAEEEAEEEALSHAIETLLTMTLRAGRKRRPSSKSIDNALQEKEAKKVEEQAKGSRVRRGGRGSRGGH
jgi:hypothetical protein